MLAEKPGERQLVGYADVVVAFIRTGDLELGQLRLKEVMRTFGRLMMTMGCHWLLIRRIVILRKR